jgi:tetratricopeptide (TPR) repeat protein
MNSKILITISLILILLCSCKQSIKQLFGQGQYYEQRENYKDAIKIYNEIIDRDSNIQLAYFNRGMCFAYLDQNINAIRDFDKVMAMQPVPSGLVMRLNRDLPFLPDEERWKVPYEEALYERAESEYFMDSLKSAFVDFRNALSLGYDPKSKCYRWLGIIYWETGNKEKGCEFLQRAVSGGDSVALKVYQSNCQ